MKPILTSLDGGKPREMADDEIVLAVTEEIRWAEQIRQDDLEGDRSLAWDYFKGRAPVEIDEDIQEHFKDIIIPEVQNIIESTLAEVCPAFGTDQPARFDEVGPGDDKAAALETDICNDILMEAGAGYVEFVTAVKDSMLQRIGCLHTIWEEKDEVTYQEIENPTPVQLAVLMRTPGVEIRRVAAENQSHPLAGGMKLEVKTKRKIKKCKICAVPPDELLISGDCESMNLDEARFVGREMLVSRSDLKAQGIDPEMVDNLRAYKTQTRERSRYHRQRNTWGRDKGSGDVHTELVQVCHCYYRLDEDRDGIAELRYILVGGSPGSWTLLLDKPASYQPFAIGAPYLWPHQPYGISYYDKHKHLQMIRSKFYRILLEAGTRAARDRVGVTSGTNIEDVRNSVFGGAVQMQSKDGVVAIPNPRFPGELMSIMDLTAQLRREGGGGAVDKAGNESIPVQAGAHGMERYMTAVEELNAMVARVIAETMVRQAYIKIHTCLRENSDPILRQVDGEWVRVDPRQWRPREKVTPATGLTGGERRQMVGMLTAQADRQMALLEKGSNLVSEKQVYKTLMDLARYGGLQHPAGYWIDPESDEAQQMGQQKAQAAQQQREAQMQDATIQADIQSRALMRVEQARGQAKVADRQLQEQGDTGRLLIEMAQEQKQFIAELGQKYDALRVKLEEIEAKTGEQTEGAIQTE